MTTAIAFCCAGGFRTSSLALMKWSGGGLEAGHENRHDFTVCGKTPIRQFREGHDFSRAAKCFKVWPRFSAWGMLLRSLPLFPQPVQPCRPEPIEMRALALRGRQFPASVHDEIASRCGRNQTDSGRKPNIFPVQASLRRFPLPCQSSIIMLRRFLPMFAMLCLSWSECAAVPKPHVITFGKWISAKWPDATGQKLLDLKVRPLFVDTRLKEYTTGTPHEMTDRLFVVRRAFRVNDALPTEKSNANANANANPTRWQWQRGGWLLVDRITGRVSQLNLPEFDPFYSTASWYRDYIAYCGVSEDGKKLYAVVAQVGRRKPILKKDAGEPAGANDPDSECPPPVWERSPMRVTFRPDDGQKLVFSIRGRVVDVVNDAEEPQD